MPLDPAGRDTAADAIQATYTFLALFDGASELAGGSYARIDISGSMSSDGAGGITITGPITFEVPSGATVDGFGIFDAITAGTRGGKENLSAAEGPYAADGQYNFNSGTITVT